MNFPRVLPEEVLTHNRDGDVWVTVFGRVMDVSDLASSTASLASKIIFSFGGKDMSHLFDRETQDVLTYVHSESGMRLCVPVTPSTPWWRDQSRVRGLLTKRSRPIRVIDLFSGLQAHLSVCAEDTVGRILERYRAYNSAVGAYQCVRGDDGLPLDEAKTLEENGIADERHLFVDLGLPEDLYVPALLLVRAA